MILFHSDLDNTLIYSYRREIGEDKVCVEIYQGREVSFMTRRSSELLQKVRERTVFVPTTTRTIEQYERIRLGEQPPEYALVCNGGVLLVKGEEDKEWYEESRKLVEDCQEELARAEKYLEGDANVTFEIRNIRQLFLFTKSARPEETVKDLQDILDGEKVAVFSNGVKVYVVPHRLSKGEAVRRFRRRIKADKVVAAGDSEFDVSMLQEADMALAPAELEERGFCREELGEAGEGKVFSDLLLEFVLNCNHKTAFPSSG